MQPKEFLDKKYTPLEVAGIVEMATKDPDSLVERSERYYHHQVEAAMMLVKKNLPNYKFVLLCGPSASGKTTTAYKLKDSLIQNGVGARVVSMDDFFLGIKAYDKLPDGTPDMESIKALDLELLNKCFGQLLRTGKSVLPTFNFEAQTQIREARQVEIPEGGVLIMEGIHALNPGVLCEIPRENVMHIYASVRSKFVCGGENILIPSDIRLMRRLVRDDKFRGYPPASTLQAWENVLEGERKNINPYRDDVEIKLDNTIDYEVCVWHYMLQSHLDIAGPEGYADHLAIERIFKGLMRFPSVDPAKIPEDSLLREFIGYSH
ncbi:MAG: nucleoside kinase [Oscillospiraceae bacterium]|nr:nucleoside kinase [Oscillospiraceae bacterium]